ncbi:MAG: hypothetical protein KDD19_06375, partial [Phaeodactylibacter sp.]|nr:hypothetical protein [Phaeodactylibacter sp.]
FLYFGPLAETGKQMEKIGFTLWLSASIGLLAYDIDLNHFYVYSEMEMSLLSLILGGLNLFSILLLSWRLKQAWERSRTILFISLAAVVSIGIYVKAYTFGDPIFDWVRFHVESWNLSFILLSLLSALILFDWNALKRLAGYLLQRKEGYPKLDEQVLDSDFDTL